MTRAEADRLGERVHRRFAELSGSSAVASSYALTAMARWVIRRRPRHILEVGPGIGTTTTALAEAVDRTGVPGIVHVAAERIPFCIERLHENLGERMDAITLVDWPTEAPASSLPFDLVVIDGLGPQAATALFDEQRLEAETAFCASHLAPRAVIIVENRREAQRATIEATARPGWTAAHIQPWDGSPGYHLYLFDPTPIEKVEMALRRAWYAAWFPQGPKLARRIYRKVTGKRLERRSLAASGPDYSYHEVDGDEPVPDDTTEP